MRKRFFIVLFALFLLLNPHCFAEAQALRDKDLSCLQKLIFQNECSGKISNLTVWGQGEEFPSFGIGHFIWYPKATQGPYKESVTDLLTFMEESGIEIPGWIRPFRSTGAPWRSREEFIKDLGSERMRVLRGFLARTMRTQTLFMEKRIRNLLPKMLDKTMLPLQSEIRRKYEILLETKYGKFAVIDYVNFKGEGLLESERYKGTGWGLLQVLLEMKTPADSEQALIEFVRAAEKVLKKRIDNSPRERNEMKWFVGWIKRVRGYLTSEC